MDTTDKEVTAISLYSGYGGLDLGVRRIIPNLRVLAYVEIEAYAGNLLAEKIKSGEMDEAPIFTDVTKFPSELFRDKVHLVLAGYPCQDFSCAGNRAGLEGNRGKMWGYTRSVINGVNARAFFGENVDGHLSLGFDTVVSDLAEDGFVVKGGLYSAFEVGAPHLRKRIFSLSFRSDPREAPWDQAIEGNRGWIDIDELKFQALTGTLNLADTPSLGHERSGRPDEGCPPDSVAGCGEGDGRELADPGDIGCGEGCDPVADEGGGSPGSGQENLHEGGEAQTTWARERCEDRYSTIEGMCRQSLGNPINDGHSTSAESGEAKGSEEEGGLQKPSGRSGSSGALADNESLGHGRPEECSGSDGGRLSDEEREERGSLRSETGRGSESDGGVADPDMLGSGQDRESTELRAEGTKQSPLDSGGGEAPEDEERGKLADPNSDGLHGEGDVGGLGEEEGREGAGGDKSPQAPTDCREGADYALELARLYDEGWPGTTYEGGEPTIDFTDWPIRWPSRPGEQQRDWERPRTILGDAKNTRRSRPDDEREEAGAGEGEHPVRTSGESSEVKEAQSSVGRESDAVTRRLHANRIDRLRMLGNGVVWLCASKAFSELLKLHKEDATDND